MARFYGIYYLFAVLVVLAVIAQARPAQEPSSSVDMMGGSVAGVPGLMPNKKGTKIGDKTVTEEAEGDDLGEDMQEAMAAAMAAQATPSNSVRATPTARPTPGIKANPTLSSAGTPKASPTQVKQDSNPLSKLPLIGGLLKGLPLPIRH